MPPNQVDFLFAGGHPSLVQDPAMFDTTALGQESAVAGVLLDDFDAPLPEEILREFEG